MEKKTIAVYEESCAHCLVCQLRCSFLLTKSFNPSQARIMVRWDDGAEITFTEDCTQCGACAQACPYGALIEEREK